MASGGLHVIGTERHESRRIDNQLRGRSGRQGDPGSTRFYVALDDDIMRLFGGDQVSKLMTIFKLPEDVPLEHGMVSRAIEQAQVKVEGFHFDSRKHLVEYDDVLTKQREIVYRRRRKILENEDQKDKILETIASELASVVTLYAGEGGAADFEKIIAEFASIIPFDPASQEQLKKQLEQFHTAAEMTEFMTTLARDTYNKREEQVTPEVMRQVERWVSLQVIDNFWMEHLDSIDDLREGIGLRGYAQKDPLVEYKNEAFNMFERLIFSIDTAITHRIYKVQVQGGPQAAPQVPEPKKMQTNDQPKAKTPVVHSNKLGRNDPCWCGSGKKWKKCHYPKLG